MRLTSFLYEFQFNSRQWLIGKYYQIRSQPKRAGDVSSLHPEKALFVLTGLIGDSIMCLPVITEARRLWPRAHIAVLGKTHQKELLAGCPDIDEFYVCDADPFSLRRSTEIMELKRWVSDQNFDAGIILLGDQYARLLAESKIPIRVGVAGTLLDSCLTHTYDIGSPRTWGTDQRLNALRCLGLKIDAAMPTLSADPNAAKSAAEKLREMGLRENTEYAVLHPFGSTPRQWWGIENVPKLSERLITDHGLQTVLVGKSYDLNGVAVDPQIESAVSEAVIDTLGKLSLPELVAVIDGSQLVITTDSGPFHIAGALHKEVVGIFRARRPEHADSYPQAEVVFGKHETCEMRCSWDACSFDPCRQMEDVAVESVLAAADQILSRRRSVK